jgi:hypothetical protein
MASFKILIFTTKVTIFFFIICKASFSQTPSITTPIPLSPNAASINTYGNVAMSLYTGQANISIPLYEFNTGYLKMPITLAYSYNGLKVEDYSGWVGTGWTLNTPSVVTRQVRSLPDESQNGYNGENKFGEKITSYLNSGATPTTTNIDFQTLLRGIVDGLKDSEPDIFVFSIPGYSGKFFFDESQCPTTIKIAKTIPYQHITIKGYFDYNYRFNSLKGQILKFEITDERGNLFTFDKKERNSAANVESADGGSSDLDFENTWYLSAAKDPFNRQINFSYKPQRKIAMPPTIYERMVIPENWTSTLYKNQSFVWEQVLDRITYRNEVVEFIEDSIVREDWNYQNWYNYSSFAGDTDLQRPRALARVRVIIDNQQIKDFNFKYSYFGDQSRLKLDEVQETNGTISIPPYEFFYKEGSFPRIGNLESLFSQDHWGYYTGGSRTTLLPPVHLVLENGSEINIDGNFRTPSPENTAAGILTSIKYPTGGTTTFIHEPNDFLGGNSETVPFGTCSQEFTSKAIATLTREIRNSFILENPQTIIVTNQTCARINYKLKAGNVPETSASIWLKNRVTGAITFQFTQRTENQPGGPATVFTGNGPSQGQVFSLVPGEYELVAYLDHEGQVTDLINISKAEAQVELFTSEPASVGAPNPNQLAGGMRVKQIKDCTIGAVSGCVTKYFNYYMPDEPLNSSGRLVAPIYYGYWTTLLYGIGNSVNVGSTPGFVYSGNSLLPVVNTLGNSVGYQFVTVLQSSDGAQGKSIHKFVSPYDAPDVGNPNFPFPPAIDRDYRRGTLIEQKDFTSTRDDVPLKHTRVSPLYRIANSTRALKTGFNFEFSTNLNDGGLALSIINSYKAQLSNYSFVPYDIESSIAIFSEQKETLQDFSNNKALVTETTFLYESSNHFRVTRKDMRNSNNEQLTSTYFYPQDVANVLNLTTSEITGISNCPDKTAIVEEKSINNGVLLSTKRNLFTGSTLSKVQQSFGLSALQDEVSFMYDAEGNVVSFVSKAGIINSYQYGYSNKLPIAYALNAKHTDIYYESFETGNVGLDDARAKSGKKVLMSNTFSFPSTFSSSTPAVMKLSYWYWANSKWNFSGELPYSASFVAPGTMIDEVRAYPAGARMITFCYKQGVGMITRTDENNQSQYFEFDELGRLIHVSDQQKLIMHAYDYYYKKGN